MRIDERAPVVVIGLVGGALIATVFGLIWFFATHHCVRSHRELHMACTTITISENNTVTNCAPYETDVCDEWEADK